MPYVIILCKSYREREDMHKCVQKCYHSTTQSQEGGGGNGYNRMYTLWEENGSIYNWRLLEP